MATCLFCFPLLSLWRSSIKTVAPVDGLCLQSAPKDTLLMCHLYKHRTPEHTHKQVLILIITFWYCCSWGWPKYWVMLISSYVNEILKENRRSAFRIATMKLPPIWESGSVWKLGMPGGKMKVYKNHADTFDLMCLVEMSLQHVQREIIVFSCCFCLPRPLRAFTQYFQITQTLFHLSSLGQLSKRFCKWIG